MQETDSAFNLLFQFDLCKETGNHTFKRNILNDRMEARIQQSHTDSVCPQLCFQEMERGLDGEE